MSGALRGVVAARRPLYPRRVAVDDGTLGAGGLVASTASLGRRFRFYASPRGAPTARRATDGLLLVPSLLGLALVVLEYPPGRVERALTRLLVTLSGWPVP